MIVSVYIRYLLVASLVMLSPIVVYSQTSSIAVNLAALLNGLEPGSKVHINANSIIAIDQPRAMYRIPYRQVNCSYLLDTGYDKKIRHSVVLNCISDKGCTIKVKYEDGWLGGSWCRYYFEE